MDLVALSYSQMEALQDLPMHDRWLDMRSEAGNERRQCRIDLNIQNMLEKRGFETDGEAKSHNLFEISGTSSYWKKPSSKKTFN